MPVPKVACTTLKLQLFFIQNGEEFNRDIHGVGNIHQVWKTREYAEWSKACRSSFDNTAGREFRFCVVRNPIRRLMSCYSNRIVQHKDLSKVNAAKLVIKHNLNQNPGFDEFLDRFEDYINFIPIVYHHAAPMSSFLGDNPCFYSRVFSINRIDSELLPILESWSGKALSPRKEQKSNSAFDYQLDSRQLAKIKKFYAADYDAYGDYFD